MNMATQRVEFRTVDGIMLRGDFYPVDVPNAPIIVMAQGLTLLKEHYIPDYAAQYQAAEIATLLYDHRGWGSSDPRDESDPQFHHISPQQQANDYHDAVMFAQTLPGIDPKRVAIWGIGHGGAACAIAAANDPNIKAVILDMPLLSGKRDAAGWPEGLLQQAWEERRAIGADFRIKRSFVKVWDETQAEAEGPRNQTLIHGEGPYGFIKGAVERSARAGTPWTNRMRLQSLIDLEGVEPCQFIAKISPTPMLLVAAAIDPLSGPIEAMRDAFAQAMEPKSLIELPKSHLDNYFDGFHEHLTAQVEWAKKTLE